MQRKVFVLTEQYGIKNLTCHKFISHLYQVTNPFRWLDRGLNTIRQFFVTPFIQFRLTKSSFKNIDIVLVIISKLIDGYTYSFC